MRHRQIAARADRRQHPRRRHAEIPRVVEACRPEDAEKGRGKSGELDPLSLPNELQTAIEALYGHYTKTFALWDQEGIDVPPVFIVVCNNTSTSKLVYDFISGFVRESDGVWVQGRFELFRNYDGYGERLPGRARCLSTARSSSRAMRSIRNSGRWRPTRSSAFSGRSSSGRVTSAPAITSLIRISCARS